MTSVGMCFKYSRRGFTPSRGVRVKEPDHDLEEKGPRRGREVSAEERELGLRDNEPVRKGVGRRSAERAMAFRGSPALNGGGASHSRNPCVHS